MERCFSKLKQFRAVATGFDKTWRLYGAQSLFEHPAIDSFMR